MITKEKLVTFCIVLAWSGSAYPQSGSQVWTAPSFVRVSQTQAPFGAAAVQLYAGRAEYEPFQIVVTAQGTSLTNVNMSASDLTGPDGETINRSNLTFYREHYVNVTEPSPDYGAGNRALGPGWYPDGLIPFADANGRDLSGSLDAAPFSVAAGKNQPVWVDLYVPPTTSPGLYNGTIAVTSNQGQTTVTISLTVWSFTLPLKPSLKSSLGLHGDQINKANDEVMIQHKLMPLLVEPRDSADLSARLGLNTSALWIWLTSDNKNCTMAAAPSVSSVQSAMSGFASGLPTYVYMADEIERCPNLFDPMKQWARNIHQAGSKTLVTMTPQSALYDDGSGTNRSAVDIWVMHPAEFQSAASRVAQAQAKGDEVWSYTALMQDPYSPKWLLDYAPINYRIFAGFLNQSHGLTGMLYWSADSWTSDPWNNVHSLIDGQYTFPGEGMLAYPGQQVGLASIVPSMRLKWLREGVEDYEYVQILKNLGRKDWALNLVRTVATDWNHWNDDPAQLEDVRRQLGEEIHRLSGGAPPSDTTPPSISAVSAASITSSSATIAWTTNEAATSQVEYGLTTAYGALTSLDGALASSHGVSLSGLSAGKTYYFRVRSKDAADNQAVSGGSQFPTSTGPATELTAPASPTPADRAGNTSTTPKLTWRATTGATSYEVWTGRSRAVLSRVATVSTNSYQLTGLSRRTTYYWKIVAKNSSSSMSSAVWSFTTRR